MSYRKETVGAGYQTRVKRNPPEYEVHQERYNVNAIESGTKERVTMQNHRDIHEGFSSSMIERFGDEA
jgi:hypothetical protein